MKNKLFLLGLIIGLLSISQNYAEKPLWPEFAWLNGSWGGNPPREGMWNSPFADELDTSWGTVRFFTEPMVIDLPGKIIYDKVSKGIIDRVYQLDKNTTAIDYHYNDQTAITLKMVKQDDGGYKFIFATKGLGESKNPRVFYKIDGPIMP